MRRTIVFVAVCASAVCAWAGAVDEAAAARGQGRLEDAAELYRAAAVADPRSEAATIGLAEALARLGRFDDALGAGDSHLARAPTPELATARARVLVDDTAATFAAPRVDRNDASVVAAKATLARRAIDELRAADGKAVAPRLLHARLLFFENQGEVTDGQRKEIDALSKEAPRDVYVAVELSRVRSFDAGRRKSDMPLWEAAVEAASAGLVVAPDNGELLLHRGTALAYLRKPRDKVLADYRRAAEAMPRDERPLVYISRYLGKDKAGCVAVLGEVQRTRTDDPALLRHLFLAMKAAEMEATGFEVLDAAVAEHPDDPAVAAVRAEALLAAGRLEEGVEAALAATARCRPPRDVHARDRVALALRSSRTLPLDDAERIWTALAAAYPADVSVPNDAGIWLRDARRDAKRALPWFERAHKLAPDDIMIVSDLGLAYQMCAEPDVERAEECYRDAVALAVRLGVAHPDRSQAYKIASENLVKLLVSQKRAKDLIALADELKDDPRRDELLRLAEQIQR